MYGLLIAAALLALSARVVALPSLQARDATRISASQLDSYLPYTQFARAAYCESTKINPWACGDACEANKDFQPKFTGGDGNAIQFYYVGYWPTRRAVVVAHQGTDPYKLCADLTDFRFVQKNLSSTLFPGVPSDVSVHSGFADEHAKTATTILDAVRVLLSLYGASTVVSVGHSLGGALAELDAMFFALNLPGVHVKSVTYGTPRVGNDRWASLFDAKVPDFVRINNKKDPVPTLPYEFLGFHHPHGEIHIAGPGEAYSCPGDDDAADSQCTISQVPTPLQWNINDHTGPYETINIGTEWCN